MKSGDKLKNAWIGMLLLSGMSLAAGAANWILLTRHDDIEIYVDDASVAKQGKMRQVWDRTDYPSPQTMVFSPFKQYRSMKALGYFNCAEKTGALRELVLFAGTSGSGEVVGHVTIPIDHLDFKTMVPGTVGAVLMRYVCGNRKSFSDEGSRSPITTRR